MDQPKPLSVSQLTTQIKSLLQQNFGTVWVAGELSNVSQPRSGHIYLSLKDAEAQIRGVIWRSAARWLRCELTDGMQVACQGELDLYAPQGTYQLVIRRVEPIGEGARQQALRQLHQQLSQEGVFDPRRKRPLPRFPRRIAVVTSPTGAAIHDFLEVLRRRWAGTEVTIVPAKVQGPGAAQQLVRAVRAAARLQPRPDLLVVTRGGGSAEDLWCFNDERLVRTVAASRVPVISAVGHEIDVTLCDLAADVRALTPSEAAERAVPARAEIAVQLRQFRSRLASALRNQASRAASRLQALAARPALTRPAERLRTLAQRLDELDARGQRAIAQRLRTDRQKLAAAAAQLESLSPLGVLQRGYSLTQTSDGQLVRRADQVAPGARILTRCHQGQLVSEVLEVHRQQQEGPEAGA